MAKFQVEKVEQIIGRSFRSKRLLLAALTHPSYPSKDAQENGSKEFQRLEFLGDSILNLFIAIKLFQIFPDADEGVLSRMRSILVSRKLLAKIARSLRLKSVLKVGGREQNVLPTSQDKIMADAFEAIVAAIYFDGGLKATESFLFQCFKQHFDQKKLFRFDPNPKSLLQEFAQKKYNLLPTYRSERHRDGSFSTWVRVKKSMQARGEGRTKQEAEIKAASDLIKKLRRKRSGDAQVSRPQLS